MREVECTEQTAAWRWLEAADGQAPVVLSCEHASPRLPEGYSWAPRDEWLVGTHWSYDIGAADLTADAAAELGCPALLARFSRLVVDPNRELASPTLFRLTAEGRTVELNHGLTDEERERRLERFYRPYHERLDRGVRDRAGAVVVSMHTFTPIYEGEPRHLEVGVLFDRDEGLAVEVARSLAEGGVEVRLNEPYSGAAGMMFAAQEHAGRYGRPSLEFEVRQDLAGSPPWRRRFVRYVRRALEVALGG